MSKLRKTLLEASDGASHHSLLRGSRIKLDEELERSIVKSDAENKEGTTLVKSILNVLNSDSDQIVRLAFETNPHINSTYKALYKTKHRLIPDSLLKRIALQSDLISSIITARCNQISVFGRARSDRFSTGYVFETNRKYTEKIDNEKDPAKKIEMKRELQRRIDEASKKLFTCGETKGWSDEDRLTFSQFLYQQVRNTLVLGRFATEIIWVNDRNGGKRFHSFRVIDAGTIYRASPQKQAGDAVRKQAKQLLEQVKNKKLVPERYMSDEYAWVQVIDETPVQAFTAEECVVYNMYPVSDIELDGYPVTPVDTMISAVTTHINITTHNKLYFQNGRATRGMLIIKSDDVDETVVSRIRQQFNASINSVSNSFRMPVFGVGSADELVWSPIDQGGRDMEFQYLNDMNARIILSAFQMSPEELPGWSYLSRGTNSQALSESNNEFRLEANRDLGIRPLISRLEDFVNTSVLPLIDPELAEICCIKLIGLDADTPEKETVRLQQDSAVHMTMDEVLEKVEKRPVGKAYGGEFYMNPSYQGILNNYLTVGQILEKFFGVENASKDPQYAYLRDPLWFQWQQMLMQMQQMQQQAQMAQQVPPGGGGSGGVPHQKGAPDSSNGQPGTPGNQMSPSTPTDNLKDKEDGAMETGETDLARSLDQAIDLLSKNEADMPAPTRRLLTHHKKTVNSFFESWQEDLKEAQKEIMKIAEKVAPKK